MPSNIILTGPPGVGKTTIVKYLIKDLSPLIIRGFYKEPITEYDVCKGYRVVTPDYQEQVIAHIYLEGPDRIGEFGVNVSGFENLVLPQLSLKQAVELFIVDEIGRMECLSTAFCKQVFKIIESQIPLIAVMSGSYIQEVERLRNRDDTVFLKVTKSNRESMWKRILAEMG